MQDSFYEAISLDRALLLAKVVQEMSLTDNDREVCVAWMAELLTDVKQSLQQGEMKKAP